MRIPKKHVLLTTLLVLVGMAASAAVAQAATPIIADTTMPPAGHSTAVCTECHVVTPTVPDVPGPGADTPGGSDESTRGVEADGIDGSDNEADHHDSATKGHGDEDEQVDDAQDAIDKAHDAAEKAHEASEHETVDERSDERDHRDTPSVDHGGAQHDGSHQRAEGSSD